MEAEYIAASKAAKKAVWMKNYIQELGMVPSIVEPEMVSRGNCRMDRVSSAENTADPLTKPMSQITHTQHLDKMGLRSMGDWL
ncbi:UNVERIFIED_CONTAM: hypothetical protein Slati_3750600 [Sesamum latifolium]|uniref:Uncharacterized protein n=1 Tax=Sesamum latifolium TaxID=2727402 RepID=A0AAW2U394_9LAMI